MKPSIAKAALFVTALLLSASASLAVENKTAAPDTTKAVSAPNTAAKKPKPKAATVKLVDINRAGKTELKTLPGVTDAAAGKIIAGRPYNTKARLITRKIVSREVYDNIKHLIVARQK